MVRKTTSREPIQPDSGAQKKPKSKHRRSKDATKEKTGEEKKKPRTARDKKEERSRETEQDKTQQMSREEPTKQSKKENRKAAVGPRKRPSFQHDKKIKTSNDIRAELIVQRQSQTEGKNILMGLNERKYEMKETIHEGKKGKIVRVVDQRGSGGVGLVAKTELLSQKRESINNEIRFLLEFQQTLRDGIFGSDHLLPICSYGSTSELAWFVQPECGPNLNDVRRQMKEELSAQTALRLGLMILDAVSCLHRCEVVHGRLEPQHVLIGADTMKSCVYLVGLGHIAQVESHSSLRSLSCHS